MPNASEIIDSFTVAASTGSYDVVIGEGLMQAVLGDARDVVFVVDSFLAGSLTECGRDAIVIEADETAKSLDRMTDIIVAMRDRRVTRDTLLIAMGGGVVQDVAAFAASIYMRGIDWIYVPTTLLSMTDSCIGGKSSINVGRYKNIVGTFHPPQQVMVDPLITRTLSAEQRVAGLCEAVKICLCRGPETLDAYLALAPGPDTDPTTLARIIALSLRAKQWFIEIDEFDQAERLVLNFGHTFGHALEAASGFGVSHGVAVGLGMLAALHLGQTLGTDYGAMPHIAAFHRHVSDLVGSIEHLDNVLSRVEVTKLMDAFESDKKHKRDAYAVIVVGADGQVARRMLPRDAASAAMVASAFSAMLDDWSPLARHSAELGDTNR